MSTIQIRIDEATKNAAKKIFDNLGIDMTTAIRSFLRQVVLKKGIPTPLLTENGLLPEQEEQILKASEEAKRGINVSEAMTPEQAIEYLKKL